MDPLSAELDLEVNGMRMDLLAAVEEHAHVTALLERSGMLITDLTDISSCVWGHSQNWLR